MKKFSKENIIEDWSCWLEEDPNHDMNKGGYCVCFTEHFGDYLAVSSENNCFDGVAEVSSGVLIFKTKEDAWNYFNSENWCPHGFYEHGGIFWNDDVVCVCNFDQGGGIELWIEKWDGFDDDVQFFWEHRDVKYKDRKELCEAQPQFKGQSFDWDGWFIVSGADVARVGYTLSESFEKSCIEAAEKAKSRKKELEKKVHEVKTVPDVPPREDGDNLPF